MYGKFEIAIFVHRSITPEQRMSVGFKEAIAFLPQLYSAHLSPTQTSWKSDGSLNSRPMRDEFLFEPSKYFDYVQEGFEEADRVELHILPGMNAEIEFFKVYKSTGHKIVFTIHDDGGIGAGFLEGARIREE